MGKKVNIGLIGTGRLGSMYAEFLKQRVPDANLVAAADLIPDRVKLVSEKYDIPTQYDNHLDLINDRDVDAVVVVATTSNHKEIVLDAAKSGKSVFCEKPMTLNLRDAREMQDAIRKHGIFYQQGYMRRFDKSFAGLKQKIDQGVIGDPVVFRGSSRDPYLPTLEYLRPENSGGQIIDQAVHDFDIARWCMGEIDTVYSMGCVLAYPEAATVGDTDNVMMSFKYASGALGEIDISRNGVYGYDIRAEVLGTQGCLMAGYLKDTPLLVLTKAGVTHDVIPYFPERFYEAYVSQLNDYLINLSEGKPPLVTIEDGIAGLQIAVAATDSLKKNKVVKVSDY